MIKGVNKKIVEINNPQNEFFEKAILYIRPEKHSMPTYAISAEAKEYLDKLKPEKSIKKKLSPPWILASAGIVLLLFTIILLML